MKIKKKKLLKYFKELGKTYQKEAEIAARDAEELKAIEEEMISRFVSHCTTNNQLTNHEDKEKETTEIPKEAI